jgi:hypothetical protein
MLALYEQLPEALTPMSRSPFRPWVEATEEEIQIVGGKQ